MFIDYKMSLIVAVLIAILDVVILASKSAPVGTSPLTVGFGAFCGSVVAQWFGVRRMRKKLRGPKNIELETYRE